MANRKRLSYLVQRVCISGGSGAVDTNIISDRHHSISYQNVAQYGKRRHRDILSDL